MIVAPSAPGLPAAPGDGQALYAFASQLYPICRSITGNASADNRSYRVSFDKIATKLPGFSCGWNARRGAEELRARFEQIEFDKTTYEFRAFTRLKQIRYLSRTGQIDGDFFWR